MREWWILKEEGSNRALLRDAGEKWANDVNGEPNSDWIHVIEKSAYYSLTESLILAKKQRDNFEVEFKREIELHHKALEGMRKLEAELKQAKLIISGKTFNYPPDCEDLKAELEQARTENAEYREIMPKMVDTIPWAYKLERETAQKEFDRCFRAMTKAEEKAAALELLAESYLAILTEVADAGENEEFSRFSFLAGKARAALEEK